MRPVWIGEGETVCANCAHYVQHYILSSCRPSGFIAANAGHCVYPRVKDRKPGACGCEHFKEKRGETDA